MAERTLTVYVANLPYDTTAEEVARLFGQFVQVLDTRILRERDTGRPRGCAFVDVASSEQVELACSQLSGSRLNGRRLEVSPARPRPGRDPGSRSGAHPARQ